jgi:SSS family solute:Na+ symporter
MAAWLDLTPTMLITSFLFLVGPTALFVELRGGVGLFFSMFLPFGPTTCALIMLAVTCIYTIQSGFYGIVVTDILQGICILIGGICIVFFAMAIAHGTDLAALTPPTAGINTSYSRLCLRI